MKNSLICITLTLLFSNLVFAGPNIDEAAKGVCKCLKAPYAQAQKAMGLIEKAQAVGDNEAFISAQNDIMGVIDASTTCFNSLSKKYPEIDRSNELKRKVMAIADKQCPNPVSGMFNRR